METKDCSKCNSSMEEGYRMDTAYGATITERWVKASEVNRNKNGALSTNWIGRIKKEYIHLVNTYKCTKCGYLESYVE